MKLISAISIIGLIFLCSCSNVKDDAFFNGEVSEYEISRAIQTDIKSHTVPVLDYSYGMFAVYDSLLVFWNPNLENAFFGVYNVDTGNEYGNFCPKGRGHNDIISASTITQFLKKGDDITTIIRDVSKEVMFVWNISRSIAERRTIYDSISSYMRKDSFTNSMYLLPNGNLLSRQIKRDPYQIESQLPYYALNCDGEITNRCYIFDAAVINQKDYSLAIGDMVMANDALKPDGSQLAQAMLFVPQINILDIESGKVFGKRLKGSKGFSALKKESDRRTHYYRSIQADDKYIYASYWGKERWEDGHSTPPIKTIHVFDWDGNLVRILNTDRSFFRLSLDPVKNRLYTLNSNEDGMYYIDLNEVF